MDLASRLCSNMLMNSNFLSFPFKPLLYMHRQCTCMSLVDLSAALSSEHFGKILGARLVAICIANLPWHHSIVMRTPTLQLQKEKVKCNHIENQTTYIFWSKLDKIVRGRK